MIYLPDSGLPPILSTLLIPGFPTRAIGDLIVNKESGKVPGILFMGRLIIFPAGLPIVVDGVTRTSNAPRPALIPSRTC